jgi:hypothetical protein
MEPHGHDHLSPARRGAGGEAPLWVLDVGVGPAGRAVAALHAAGEAGAGRGVRGRERSGRVDGRLLRATQLNLAEPSSGVIVACVCREEAEMVRSAVTRIGRTASGSRVS